MLVDNVTSLQQEDVLVSAEIQVSTSSTLNVKKKAEHIYTPHCIHNLSIYLVIKRNGKLRLTWWLNPTAKCNKFRPYFKISIYLQLNSELNPMYKV